MKNWGERRKEKGKEKGKWYPGMEKFFKNFGWSVEQFLNMLWKFLGFEKDSFLGEKWKKRGREKIEGK